MYLVIKKQYGDFDIRQDEVIGYTETESIAKWHVKLGNETRTQKEIDSCLEYFYKKVKELK